MKNVLYVFNVGLDMMRYSARDLWNYRLTSERARKTTWIARRNSLYRARKGAALGFVDGYSGFIHYYMMYRPDIGCIYASDTSSVELTASG